MASLRRIHNDLRPLQIERRRRLIRENDAWSVGKRAGNGDALPFPAGKVGRHGVLAVADFQIIEDFDRLEATASSCASSGRPRNVSPPAQTAQSWVLLGARRRRALISQAN
jgi:hypothetical protein